MNALCLDCIRNGSEFLVAYASSPVLPRATLFLVGHAVELHLKAVYIDRYVKGASNEEIFKELRQYSHDVKELWDFLKSGDPNFMPNYTVREDLYGKNLMDSTTMTSLSEEDRIHLSEYSELYMIMGHLQDLKYLFLPWNPGSFGIHHPNPFWKGFFKELRSYLRYPEANGFDHLGLATGMAHPPQSVVLYLDSLRA